MGADIEGAGTSTIRVRGVDRLHGTTHTIIADRIEAGTFLCAGAMTGGELRITNCVPDHLRSLVVKMQQAGIEVHEEGKDCLIVHGGGAMKAVDMKTEEYPGFRDRPSGPVHGADDAGRRHLVHHGDDLREPVSCTRSS